MKKNKILIKGSKKVFIGLGWDKTKFRIFTSRSNAYRVLSISKYAKTKDIFFKKYWENLIESNIDYQEYYRKSFMDI